MATEDVRAALGVAARKLARPRIVDPPPNYPRDIDGEKVKPGEWAADLYGMPPGCPIEPLGMEGDVVHMIDALGQLASAKPSELGQAKIQSLFGDRQNYLYWAWPRHDKNGYVAAWRAEKARECFYTAAARKGLFSPQDSVRGRGGWADRRGALIWHSGDQLWRSDRRRKRRDGSFELLPENTGYVDGHFYPRRPDVLAPWTEAITARNNPAREILVALRRWNWERPEVDPVLFLGWLTAALLGGALDWRPMIFVTGDAAAGKSTLQKLSRAVLGDALLQAADTTAAGIYQCVRQDALPVAIDEMEAESDPRRGRAIMNLARLASSGAKMRRGGTEHDPVEFEARNCFFFSAINAPGLEPAEESRTGLMRLRRLDPRRSGEAAPTLDAETTGPRLLRQAIDQWDRFPVAWRAYRDVLRDVGHDGRAQDTLGALLACADLALGPDVADALGVPMVDDLSLWGQWLPAEERTANWLGCLRHLLTARVEAWRNGTRTTIGKVLEDVIETKEMGFVEARTALLEAGVTIAKAEVFGARYEDAPILCIPNESPKIATLFRDTKWIGQPGASVWKSALRQAPEGLLLEGVDNRVRIDGVRVRCALVRLGVYWKGEW